MKPRGSNPKPRPVARSLGGTYGAGDALKKRSRRLARKPAPQGKRRANPAMVDRIIVAFDKRTGNVTHFWKGMEWGTRMDWAARWHDKNIAYSAAQDILRLPSRSHGMAIVREDFSTEQFRKNYLENRGKA